MKEIQAYVHRSRIADVVEALKGSTAPDDTSGGGYHNLAVYVVKGSLAALDAQEQHYSLDLGSAVIDEYKLELICEDADVDAIVALIKTAAHTGQTPSGWLYVVDVVRAERIA